MDNKKIILGIDPGKTGGMAIANTEKILDVFSFKNKTDMNIYHQINDWKKSRTIACCYLELVHSMPYQSSVATFTFGQQLARIETILNLIRLSVVKVAPHLWQKKMMCLTKGDKRITRNKAKALFPYIKITHQIADACLIAMYGARAETAGLHENIDNVFLRFTGRPGKRKD